MLINETLTTPFGDHCPSTKDCSHHFSISGCKEFNLRYRCFEARSSSFAGQPLVNLANNTMKCVHLCIGMLIVLAFGVNQQVGIKNFVAGLALVPASTISLFNSKMHFKFVGRICWFLCIGTNCKGSKFLPQNGQQEIAGRRDRTAESRTSMAF